MTICAMAGAGRLKTRPTLHVRSPWWLSASIATLSKFWPASTRCPPLTRADVATGAIRQLTVAEGADPWHRDGWIFQTISWIAAHRTEKGVVVRAPHAIPAHKGFDGMQLRLDEAGKAVTAMVIFEDKATDDPRKTLRTKVWAGIRALEAGQRMPELVQETTSILEAH